MRNLHLLPIPEENKAEIAHNDVLCRSLYGVNVDVLEVNDGIPIVRVIHNKNLNEREYTQKELIAIAKEVLLPAIDFITSWHWRPLDMKRLSIDPES